LQQKFVAGDSLLSGIEAKPTNTWPLLQCHLARSVPAATSAL
jgi:hypothetical protein